MKFDLKVEVRLDVAATVRAIAVLTGVGML